MEKQRIVPFKNYFYLDIDGIRDIYNQLPSGHISKKTIRGKKQNLNQGIKIFSGLFSFDISGNDGTTIEKETIMTLERQVDILISFLKILVLDSEIL